MTEASPIAHNGKGWESSKAQAADKTMSGRGLPCLNLQLRPKTSNQSIKTDVASCASQGPKAKMFLEKFCLLQSARFDDYRQTCRRTRATSLPVFFSAFLLLKYICTCKTQTVLCVCIWFYVLYVTHFVHNVVIEVQLSQHRSTIRPCINIWSHQ